MGEDWGGVGGFKSSEVIFPGTGVAHDFSLCEMRNR